MTLTLELTLEAEEKLKRNAAQRGLPLLEYAQAVLLSDADSALPVPGNSVYEDLKDFIGVFQGREQTSYSENTGAKFAEALQEKWRQGSL